MARAKHKYHFTYKTVNMINGKYYVGMHSTSNLEDGYLGSGKRFRYSLNKYGKENFKREILQFFENKEKLIEGEINLIDEKLLQDPLCMNIMLGGDGGFTKEIQLLGSIAGHKAYKEKLETDPEFAKRISLQRAQIVSNLHKTGRINAKLIKSFKDKTHTEETKSVMSDKAKERLKIKNGSLNTCWIHNETKSIKIKSNDLTTYINDGWIKGRKINF